MREPQLTTPFGRLAWELYVEEVLSRMSQVDDVMGMAARAFLEGMEDQIIEVAETIDQDPELQASIIARLERALAEVRADRSEVGIDAEETGPV